MYPPSSGGIRLPVLSKRRVDERTALAISSFLIFVLIIPCLFLKINFTFCFGSPSNTLFSFALLGGTLCKWTHAKSVIQRLASLDTMFLRFMHIDVCNRSSCSYPAVEYCTVWLATFYFSILQVRFFTDIWRAVWTPNSAS